MKRIIKIVYEKKKKPSLMSKIFNHDPTDDKTS